MSVSANFFDEFTNTTRLPSSSFFINTNAMSSLAASALRGRAFVPETPAQSYATRRHSSGTRVFSRKMTRFPPKSGPRMPTSVSIDFCEMNASATTILSARRRICSNASAQRFFCVIVSLLNCVRHDSASSRMTMLYFGTGGSSHKVGGSSPTV